MNTSNYELERLLPKGKKQKSHRINERWLNAKLMTEFAALRSKAYSYLTDHNCEKKKEKGTKNVS